MVEDIPQWAKKMQLCLDDLTTKVDKMPVKIKRDLLPQLVVEVRNTVKSELDKRFK